MNDLPSCIWYTFDQKSWYYIDLMPLFEREQYPFIDINYQELVQNLQKNIKTEFDEETIKFFDIQ